MKIIDIEKCTGCTACFSICPIKAISMKDDENGFKYPVINDELCIKCNLCIKTCPVLKNVQVNNSILSYSCYNKREKIRKNSSSGGIFYSIAEYVISKNGVVFGAAFNENFEVIHTFVEKKDEIYKLQGSKYVQSNLLDSYSKVKEFLLNDRLVLFTGTPCQIEGLLSYLNNNYKNLITQDFICHGIPSPKVWSIYKNMQGINKEITSEITFRAKTKGWQDFSMKIIQKNKEYDCSHSNDYYMKAFLNDLCLRESCYQCNAKKYNRLSDITLADFWGVQEINPKINDDKGLSLVIINSEKGEKLFKSIRNELIYEKINLNEALKYNPSMTNSVKMNNKREVFLKNVNEKNFEKLVNKYTRDTLINRIKGKIKHIVKLIIKYNK